MGRTVYVPNISDHAYVVAAAMRSYGLSAEVLPPPTEESMRIALEFCRGRECLPCFGCVGDVIRHTRQPGHRPDQATYFMPGGSGPCRLPQYGELVREALEALGLAGVEVMQPSADNGYRLFGEHPRQTRMLSVAALAGVDVLQKALHEIRPYELEPGTTDGVYRRSLDHLTESVERDRSRGALQSMRQAVREFAAIPVDLTELRPVVAVLGEVYVLLNSYMNNDLVRAVEAAGGEVLIGTFLDVLDMTETNNSRRRWREARFGDFLGADISRRYQRMVFRRMHGPFARLLRHPLEGPLRRVYKLLDPYFDTDLGGEGVLTLARALELSSHGIGAVINVMPFTCMAGLVAVAMAPSVRPAMGGIPWLDISFDGQETTNIRTRLEALMHQASQFDRRGRANGFRHRRPAGSARGDEKT